MSDRMIHVFGPNVGREEIDALSDSVMSGWMGMGPKVKEFEKQMSQRFGAPFLMVDSGTNALWLAATVLDLPAGSDIIVPALTWAGCAQAVMLAGHRPVFADVNLETYNVDAECVARARTAQTRAVMVVHYAGRPVRMGPILELGLPVIEDAAHAVDSQLGGRWCGTIGRIGIFSFDAVKNLATPNGGGITCADQNVIRRLAHLRYSGMGKSGFDASATVSKRRWWEYDIFEPFAKVLPNDIAASIALAQLKKLDANQRRRREIWSTYQRELKNISWLQLPIDCARDERDSYFTYLVRVLSGRRDELAHALLDKKIYTGFRFHPLHLVPLYRSSASLPNCELLNEQGLNLPLHPSLTDADLDRVLDALRRF